MSRRPGQSGPERRLALSSGVDVWLSELFEQAIGTHKTWSQDFALVAVGSYGRRELGANSDLDLVLVHADSVTPDLVAEKLWYPIWDSGVNVDHSVRTIAGARVIAASDVKALPDYSMPGISLEMKS